MPSACAHCGQKLRSGWQHCPRCRARIVQEPSPSKKAGERASASTRIVAGGMAIIGLVIAAYLAVPGGDALQGESDGDLNDPAIGLVLPPNATVVAEPGGDVRASNELRAGGAAYAQGDLPGALAHFAAAVEASPDHAEARNNLAQVLVRQGKPREALVHLDAAVRLAPDQWSYRFNRARTLTLLDRWLDAVAEYEIAARLFPDDYATQHNLGLALTQLRRFDDGVRALERAVELAPEQHTFLISLGTALVGLEQPARAHAVFEQFLERAPDHPEAPRVRALLTALAATRP